MAIKSMNIAAAALLLVSGSNQVQLNDTVDAELLKNQPTLLATGTSKTKPPATPDQEKTTNPLSWWLGLMA